MSDITSGALGSLNATITILKGLSALNRQYSEAELRGKVVDALEQATEARAAILALQEQNRDLQAKLDITPGAAPGRRWPEGLAAGARARVRGPGRQGPGLALPRGPDPRLAQGEAAGLPSGRAGVL